MPRRYILEGSRELKPFTQGQLSSLCGTYSVLNALQLVTYPTVLPRTAWQDLYRSAIKHLASRRKLKSTLMSGMTHDTWRELQLALCEDARALGIRVRMRINRKAKWQVGDELSQWAEEALHAGKPLLCSIHGSHAHYTVLSGLTEKRLLLFDSSQLRWLGRQSTSWGCAGDSRHWIDGTSISTLERY